jgi:hypothetical protein
MRDIILVGVVVGLVSVAGCGSAKTAAVSGSVVLNGTPVEEGAIQFIPVDGNTGASSGVEIRNGRYHIPAARGAAVGKNRVELRTFRKTGRTVQDPTGLPGVKTEERVQAFPPEYSDQSTVVRDVKPGSNTFDFDVQTGKK